MPERGQVTSVHNIRQPVGPLSGGQREAIAVAKATGLVAHPSRQPAPAGTLAPYRGEDRPYRVGPAGA